MLAGYEVAAIDAFADMQTRALCQQLMVVPYAAQGFDAAALMTAMNALDLSQFDGLVYGSGFEAQPALLEKLAQQIPLLGNAAEVVAQVKNPHDFFASLNSHQIAYPDWGVHPPQSLQNMLVKTVGASGGSHIQYADMAYNQQELACYFQQKVEGKAVSLLFIAHQQGLEIIGFNELWTAPACHAPFRYGGAVSNADLSEQVKSQLRYAAEKLRQHFGLLGLNSLDAVVKLDADSEQVLVLEINPRPSATVDLYMEKMPDLLARHIQACQKVLPTRPQAEAGLSKAHAVVYADEGLLISPDFAWPHWVKDNPMPDMQSVKILAKAPLCMVHGVAKNASAAKRLAKSRAVKILALLKQQNKSY